MTQSEILESWRESSINDTDANQQLKCDSKQDSWCLEKAQDCSGSYEIPLFWLIPRTPGRLVEKQRSFFLISDVSNNAAKYDGVEINKASVQFSCVQLFATPWITASQASLSITNSRSLLKLMSIESVMTPSHLILHHPLLLLPSIFPRVRVFSNESVLCIRWPKYWSFSFSISPSNTYSGLISFRMDWLDLFGLQGVLRVFSNTTVQKHQCFGTQLSL